MPLVFTNEGEARILSIALGAAAQEALTLKLFASNTVPAETDTAATYTEAVGGGYAAVPLVGGNWVVTPGDPTVAAYPQQAFTFTGPLTGNPTVYGYYVVGATSGKLYWAERLAAAFTPANAGDGLKITLKITLE